MALGTTLTARRRVANGLIRTFQFLDNIHESTSHCTIVPKEIDNYGIDSAASHNRTLAKSSTNARCWAKTDAESCRINDTVSPAFKGDRGNVGVLPDDHGGNSGRDKYKRILR